MSVTRWGRGAARVLLLVVLFGLMACTKPVEHPSFVARVGDQYFTQAELGQALATLPAHMDTVQTREQIIEKWVTNQLLLLEARRRNLEDDPEVIRLLKENEQAILISQLVSLMHDLTREQSPSEVRGYYERYQEQLRLREPYLHVRYLSTRDSADAAAAYAAIADIARSPRPDSLWLATIDAYADDPDAARALSSNYFSEGRLFGSNIVLRQYLQKLTPGQLTEVFSSGGTYHLLQLVDRVPEGTVPEMAWIESEIRQRLMIESRKQLYMDQVQRLKNEALARGQLELR